MDGGVSKIEAFSLFCSSRQQSVGDETPIDHTSHSLMTTEASSNDMPTALNQVIRQ